MYHFEETNELILEELSLAEDAYTEWMAVKDYEELHQEEIQVYNISQTYKPIINQLMQQV